MLKMAENSNIGELLSFLNKVPLGVLVSGKILTYGFDRSFFTLWFQQSDGEIHAVISLFEGSFVLCADGKAQCEEIFSFVNSYGFASLMGEKGIIEKCGFCIKEEKTMFCFSGGTFENVPQVSSFADLKQVYALISSSIPNSFPNTEDGYLSFLSDFTFRQRRNRGRVRVIEEKDELLSCALTSSESETAALISGVACNEKCRGKGLGKRTVLYIANELKNEGKEVYVIALNDSAKSFYKKIGFTEYVTVAYLWGNLYY